MTLQTVLVTGGAGYIGSHAVLALIEGGYRPVVLDDLSTGVRQAVPAGVTFYQANVGDTIAVDDILVREQPMAVMHFAGSLIVAESVADPGHYYANNLTNSLSLARACIKAQMPHFVFSSTAAVYGNPETSLVAEDAPTRPINPYGHSKLMTEQVLFDLASAHPGFRPVCLRYFNVAGADSDGRAGQRGLSSTHLIRSAVEVALGKRSNLEIFGSDYPTRDGTGERDFIHVSDLASAHVAALAYMIKGGEACAINCGYGRGFTVKEVVAVLERISGSQLPTHTAPRRAGDAAAVIADISRLKRKLDWRARYPTLEAIIESELRWARTC